MMKLGDSQDLVGYSLDEVESLTSPVDAMTMLDEYGIPYEDLENLEDWKERLRCHYNSVCYGSPRQQMETNLTKSARENKHKRKKLIELMTTASNTLDVPIMEDTQRVGGRAAGSLVVESLLIKEGLVNNLREEFTERINLLSKGECVVLVSGETSAGKSTVVNMILEEDILPTHVLPCTSVITKISYAPKRMARIIFREGEARNFSELNADTLKEIWDIVYQQNLDLRSKISTAKEVDIFLPLEFLRTGIKLVDSPGIGENEAMNKTLSEFIEENQISGFLYILFSDYEGGVDEDRLLNLLRVVLEKQKTKCFNQINNFDPRSAIFVFNRWDLVTDKKRVYETGRDRIGSCWPNLEESQLICLDAKTAMKHFVCDPSYICEPYRQILESLKEIYISSHEKRVQAFYRWIEKLTSRSVHHLKTLFRRLDSSEEDLHSKVVTATEKLQNLMTKSDAVINLLQRKIELTTAEITECFREHLNSPMAQIEITQWLPNELVPASEFSSWETVREYLDDTIKSRVGKILRDWNHENLKLERLEDEMTEETRRELHLLEEEIGQVENDLQDNDSIISDDDVIPGNNRRMTLAGAQFTIGTAMKLHLTSANTPPRLPVRLMAKVMKPFKEIQQKSKMKEYVKDPNKVMAERAKKHWQNLIQSDSNDLNEFINGLMQRPVGYLNLIANSIPKIISTNEELIEHIKTSRKQTAESREMYEMILINIEALMRVLREFGHGYVFVNDFADNEIRLKTDVDSKRDISGSPGTSMSRSLNVSAFVNSGSFTEASKSKHPMGLWTIHQNGFHIKEDREENVTIRIYLKSSNITNAFREVAKLRCLVHEYVANFLGIYQSDAFVFESHLKSARLYITSTIRNVREEIPRVLEQTARGLDYIHRKNLVHMELSCNTVTVDEDGEVKLSGICLARKAQFPMDTEAIQAGEFVYLAPEVLHGDIYTSQSDIYSLALFIVEMMFNFNKRCFYKGRKCSLYQFVDDVTNKRLDALDDNPTFEPLTESSGNLICWCLKADPSERPTDMSVIISAVEALKKERHLADISARNPRHQVIKRKSDHNMRISTIGDNIQNMNSEAEHLVNHSEQIIYSRNETTKL